jgi:hypothetical protein
MLSSLVHLMLSLSISYPCCLIKYHDFADNSHEGMKQMRAATQVQQGMTLTKVYVKDLKLSPKKIHPLFSRRIGTKIDMNGPSVRLKMQQPE